MDIESRNLYDSDWIFLLAPICGSWLDPGRLNWSILIVVSVKFSHRFSWIACNQIQLNFQIGLWGWFADLSRFHWVVPFDSCIDSRNWIQFWLQSSGVADSWIFFFHFRGRLTPAGRGKRRGRGGEVVPSQMCKLDLHDPVIWLNQIGFNAVSQFPPPFSPRIGTGSDWLSWRLKVDWIGRFESWTGLDAGSDWDRLETISQISNGSQRKGSGF